MTGASRPSRIATWLAVLALAFQCFVVQTHVHAGAAPVEAVASFTHQDGVVAQAPHEDAICLLCEQMALAGTVLLPAKVRATCDTLRVAIDLNAVPPAGIEGVEVGDRGAARDGLVCFGALGVGGDKMKVHRKAVAQLFERNDQSFDAEEIYQIAQEF